MVALIKQYNVCKQRPKAAESVSKPPANVNKVSKQFANVLQECQ